MPRPTEKRRIQYNQNFKYYKWFIKHLATDHVIYRNRKTGEEVKKLLGGEAR